MTLAQAIIIVDISVADKSKRVRDAWDVINAKLAESRPTVRRKPPVQQAKVTIPRSCKVCKFKIKCAFHKRNDGFCIERHSGVL
jgi:hypothetical protein